MGYSEIVVMFVVYSGFIAFFLVPFQSGWNVKKQQQDQMNFNAVFKESLIKIVVHKKAVFAFLLLILTLFAIWSVYEGAEYQYNAHSGYPPISTDVKAIYTMCGVFMYTVVLYVGIAFMRTLKIVKNECF